MGLTWMAWTWQTATFFGVIGLMLIGMSVWELKRPGGDPRHGVLGLDTTRGDRLFISLLGSAFIHLAWLAFAIGPGARLGNDLFGAPDSGLEAWRFGLPSLWAWQILAWLLGVFLIWLLAYKLALSRPPRKEVEALIEDIGDMAPLQERE